MRYQGSKNRISQYICPIIQKIIQAYKYDTYVEPFVGGANIIDKIQCKKRLGYDINKPLIELYKYIQYDNKLPDAITKDIYDDVRISYRNDENKYPLWYVGAVEFLSSFNGRGFNGGFAKGSRTSNSPLYYVEYRNNLLKQVPYLKDIVFKCDDYRNLTPINSIIYCDPPYADTKDYSIDEKFDSDIFWQYMRKWSENNFVLISEYSAPKDFISIWQGELQSYIGPTSKEITIEHLFIHECLKSKFDTVFGKDFNKVVKSHKLF
jgi:DNA adenine methylase